MCVYVNVVRMYMCTYVNSTSVVHWICVHIFPFLSPLYAGVNKQKKKIIIMRGLPGSGKSTLARFVTHCAQVYIRTYMARLVHCAYIFVCVFVCVWHSLQGFEGEDWSHLLNRRFLLPKWTVSGHTYSTATPSLSCSSKTCTEWSD